MYVHVVPSTYYYSVIHVYNVHVHVVGVSMWPVISPLLSSEDHHRFMTLTNVNTDIGRGAYNTLGKAMLLWLLCYS